MQLLHVRAMVVVLFALNGFGSAETQAGAGRATADQELTGAAHNSSSTHARDTDKSPSFKTGEKNRAGRMVVHEQHHSKPKQLWANSFIFRELPLLDKQGRIQEDQQLDQNLPATERICGFLKFESWYNHPPANYTGKFVLIEFAASWCGACKRSLKHIEHFHETFPEELVVISIFETSAQQNNDFPRIGAGRAIKHSIAIDTQRRCANALGVYGIPHAILIEPDAGVIVWEGMVHQQGYELTDELLRKFFALGLAK
jgi:thiol-disulfide isomerase/thioredoxin